MARGAPGWLGWVRDQEQARRAALLSGTPVFAGLPRRLLGRLGAHLFEKAYEAGEVVFHEGESGKGLFVIVEGSVAITHSAPDGERLLVSLGPGQCFGELALVDDAPRSATARTTGPTRLLILYRSHFEALVEGNRGIALVVMRNLLRTFAEYVRRANTRSLGQAEHPSAAAPPGDGRGSAEAPERP